MKKLLLLLALACGDHIGDEIDYSKDPPPADAGNETGSLRAPIIIHGEYGTSPNMGPCAWDGSGTCYGADSKTIKIVWHPYTCAKAASGQSAAWWYQMVFAGLKRGIDYLNHRSWNVTYVTANSPPANQWALGNVQVSCSTGAGAIGQTSINEVVFDPWDCHDTDLGEFCQYYGGSIIIRPNKASGNPVWSTTTGDQRKNMINNVVFHEVMHYAGLPHRPSNEVNVMMPAIQAWLSPQWTTKMVPDVNQSLSLYCYVPSSSTTPIVGCPAQ